MTVALHGHEALTFPSWNEDVTYLERVTVEDHADAVDRIATALGVDPDDLNVTAIWMRWVDDAGPDGAGGWGECEEDAPGAVPFWKDDPYDP